VLVHWLVNHLLLDHLGQEDQHQSMDRHRVHGRWKVIYLLVEQQQQEVAVQWQSHHLVL
jgi:hypothetical protein